MKLDFYSMYTVSIVVADDILNHQVISSHNTT